MSSHSLVARAHARGPTSAERAWLYELTHTGRPGDEVFYAEQCKGLARVLEFGCGSGRVLRRLGSPGRQVAGVDLSAASLARARATLEAERVEGVELFRGDMRWWRGEEPFDAVLIPYNGLFALDGEADVAACLANAAANLRPGGWLQFDVYVVYPDDFRTESGEAGPWDELFVRDAGDVRIRAFERVAELEGLRWRMDYRYGLSALPGAVGSAQIDWVDTTIYHHAIAADDLMGLVESAGFEIDAIWTSFAPWTRSLDELESGRTPSGGTWEDDDGHESALVVSAVKSSRSRS